MFFKINQLQPVPADLSEWQLSAVTVSDPFHGIRVASWVHFFWQSKLMYTRIESSTHGSTTIYSFSFQDIFKVDASGTQTALKIISGTGKIIYIVIVTLETLRWNWAVICLRTFSLCGGDSGSSALSSSAWKHLWPGPSRGSMALDLGEPSLESQIAEVLLNGWKTKRTVHLTYILHSIVKSIMLFFTQISVHTVYLFYFELFTLDTVPISK